MTRPPVAVAAALVAATALLPVLALAAGWEWYLAGAPLVLLAVASAYAAGAWLPPPAAVGAVAVSVALLVTVNQAHGAPYHWLDDVVFFVAVVAGSAAAGRAVTVRATQVERLRRLAGELHEQQRLAVAAARLEEQTRVQQQVHVGLAERVAAIAVRAEGAQRVGDTGSLEVLEVEARAVLDEVREVLGSLATPGPEQTDVGAEAGAPAPGPAVGPSRYDVALAAVVGVAAAVEGVVHPLSRGPAWANLAVALLLAAPLVVRRSHPAGAVAGTLAVAVATCLWLTPVTVTVTGVALMSVLFYSLGAWSPPRRWVPVWAVGAAVTVLLMLLTEPGARTEPEQVGLTLGWLCVAVLLGRVTAGAQARARRTAEVVAALERNRGTATRLATARERQALASQLHDTVAHSMTVVCLQAAAARRGGDGTPGVSEALGTIAATAAASVAELRDGLDAIEAGDHPLDPSRLVAVGRRVGVDVQVRQTAPPLAGPVAALAFRVVREAVVNVARHAPGATAEVCLTRAGRGLRVQVTDTGGPGSPGAVAGVGSGTGLAGLARAVRSAGGDLVWGPGTGGGFEVVLDLPTDVPASRPTDGSAAAAVVTG